METALQAFLRGGGTPADLEAQYAIRSMQHRRYPQLRSFKYDQIRSDMSQRICQEARGSVLDAAQNWDYVARAWDKFWNYGEALAAPIDWPHARVQEKIDGSLCIVYWYGGHWEVATSGSADASGPVDRAGTQTFADLFQQTARDRALLLGDQARAYTWMFELTSPLNRIVVRHGAPNITLIGCRETATGREIPVLEAARLIEVADVVREFPLRSWADVEATFAILSPLEQEGYVVVSYSRDGVPDGEQFPRVKVKHPGYVALHQMKSRFTPRGLVDVIRRNEMGEVLAAFPELTDLRDMSTQYDALCAEIDSDWGMLRRRWDGIPPRKEFAAAALQTRCPGALFARLDGKAADARAFLATAGMDLVLRLLGMTDTPAPPVLE
jgi:hypothetical protein